MEEDNYFLYVFFEEEKKIRRWNTHFQTGGIPTDSDHR
jgi:hypothetical protein